MGKQPTKKRHPRAHAFARAPHEMIGPDSTLLDDVAAERQYAISRYTFRAKRRAGTGPKYVLIGSSVRYRRRDLDQWVAENVVEPGERAAERRAAKPKKAAAVAPPVVAVAVVAGAASWPRRSTRRSPSPSPAPSPAPAGAE